MWIPEYTAFTYTTLTG